MKSASFASQNPTILVILGATGDLARHKLIPGLFRLYTKKLLPPTFQVVGFSRQSLSHSEYQNLVREILKPLARREKKEIERFSTLFFYQQGFFDSRKGYNDLAKLLGGTDTEWRTCANKLFHLAVPPKYYGSILKHLSASHLTDPCSPEEGWTRVVVEKPFGKDAKTAQELDMMLGKLFKEEQIYRIDHYLGKETTQNILAFRFSNSFLEPAWDNRSIESIYVAMFEKKGIEGRGEFYDGVGALRDVGQNHVLQLLALFTMENPGSFDVASIRTKRAEILRALAPMTSEQIAHATIRGQYRGYLKEKSVAANSKTETYFKIKTELTTPRWEGVPIYLEAGKRMSEDKVEIGVVFKHPSPCLCPPESGTHYKNILRYELQPNEGITTSFWVKKPGALLELEEKDFRFDYKEAYHNGAFLDPYERLYLDVIRGNQSLFVSTEEIAESWRFVDPIVSAWKQGAAPLTIYTPGSGAIRKKPVNGSSSDSRQIGIIGLGKMGKGIVARLAERGWKVVAYDHDPKTVKNLMIRGVRKSYSQSEFMAALRSPRIVWIMVPSSGVDAVLFERGGIGAKLKKGDTVIDGGNSLYEDSVRRGRELAPKGIHFIDVGVSGGPEGARNGAALMVGGDEKAVHELGPLFRDLAAPGGYAHVGKSGAGHFAKMVHNGIEYGMMQALAEGFAVMKKSPYKFNLKKIANVYNHGSVIESRLVGWLTKGFEEYGEDLKKVSGSVAHTGEGEWMVQTAKKLNVPTPIIAGAAEFRVASAKKPKYIGKILSALRNQFGGHKIST